MGTTSQNVQEGLNVPVAAGEAAGPGLERDAARQCRVVEIDPQTDPRWDAFVSAHPEGLIYHTASYLHALSTEYGTDPICLAGEDLAGQVRGILPLMYTKGLPLGLGGRLFGRRLSSLPRTPVAGPLALDENTTIELLRAALERTDVRNGANVQIKPPRPLGSGLAEGLIGRPWRKTYVLELPPRPALLHFGNSRNHTRLKQRVNKAVKAGVKIRQGELEDLRAWYDIYLETMRWHLVAPRPYRFFRALWDDLRPDRIRLLLAYKDGNGLLAGSIFMMSGRTVFYAFNGRRREDLSLQPNYAIIWQAIHDACEEGFRYFDLGEVPLDNLGLSEFKGKWAGSPTWLVRYYYPKPPETSGLESGGRKSFTRRCLNIAWRRLPIPLTRWFGDWVYYFL
jgi:hypothetical protein